jgi:hypothetical protein
VQQYARGRADKYGNTLGRTVLKQLGRSILSKLISTQILRYFCCNVRAKVTKKRLPCKNYFRLFCLKEQPPRNPMHHPTFHNPLASSSRESRSQH